MNRCLVVFFHSDRDFEYGNTKNGREENSAWNRCPMAFLYQQLTSCEPAKKHPQILFSHPYPNERQNNQKVCGVSSHKGYFQMKWNKLDLYKTVSDQKTLKGKDVKWREKEKEQGQVISTVDYTHKHTLSLCWSSADALPMGGWGGSEGKGWCCDWQEVMTRKFDNKTLIMIRIISIRETLTHTLFKAGTLHAYVASPFCTWPDLCKMHLQVSIRAKWCHIITRAPSPGFLPACQRASRHCWRGASI